MAHDDEDQGRTALILAPRLHPPRAPGSGALAFTRVGSRTVVDTIVAQSPLKFLTPKNHGDAAWVYVANFGGGLVDGDALTIRASVAEGARAWLGTQSSTKVYRSPTGCRQRLDARVGPGSLLAVVPDPVVCFKGARYTQDHRIALEPSASLLLVDGFTSGRSLRGERWEFARYESRTVVTRSGVPLFVDATRIESSHGDIPERMGRFDAFATAFVVGPLVANLLSAFLAPLPALVRRSEILYSASAIGDDACVLRIGATSAFRAAAALREYLAPLSRILGDDPYARKW